MIDVKQIIESINRNGIQGPKNLSEERVYSWVKKDYDISYEEYMSIIDENTIPESERETNRNSYFIKTESGKYEFYKSNEAEIRKYLCYIIMNNPNTTSSEARIKFKTMYKDYTLIDLMNQQNLTSNQDIIDQTIRNILVSNYYKKKNNELFYRSEDKPYRYTVKPKGMELAKELEDRLINEKELDNYYNSIDDYDSSTISKLYYYTDEELSEIHEKNKNYNIIEELEKIKNSKSNRFPTDPKIKYTRFKKNNFMCEIDNNHKTFKTDSMPNFIIGHHIVPMEAQKNFPSIKLDCIENMSGICPICHDQIHYGTKEEKRKIFNKLIELRKSDLLSIGFTKEILNVIFDMYY